MRVKIDMETECDALCICEYAQAQTGSKPLWLLLHRGENQKESQASEIGLLEICESSAACVCVYECVVKTESKIEYKNTEQSQACNPHLE